MSVEETTKQRGSRYGEFRDNSYVTQTLYKAIMDRAYGFDRSFTDAERESIHMICHKLARVVCGHGKVKDNWHDICGYALITLPLLSEHKMTGFPIPNDLCMEMYITIQQYRTLEEYEKKSIFGILTMLSMLTVMSDESIWKNIITYAEAAEELTEDE